MKQIIFLGSAGVGKGTNAKFVSKHYKIPVISSGELLRAELKAGTEIGKKVESSVDAGELAPNKIVNQLIKKRISQPDCKSGFIFDGFPRSVEQAKWLDRIAKIDAVINFTAPEKVLLERLGGRRHCSKCSAGYNINTMSKPKNAGICDKCRGRLVTRDDDKPAAIKQRLKVYQKEVKPVVEYYKKKGILKDVDSSLPYSRINEIVKATIKAINKLASY